MTKLYFHAAANDLSGTFPSDEQSAATPNWLGSGGTVLRKMDSAIGVAQASLSAGTVNTTIPQNGYLCKWVSKPLDGAQTVGGGSMVLNVADSESDVAANYWVNTLNVYVWRPSTGAKVGTIRDAAGTSLGGTEGGTTETVTHITGITSASVLASDGDVVICELWSRHTQSIAANYTVTLYYDGTTENTTENASVSNHASYLELAETLVFQVPPYIPGGGFGGQSFGEAPFGGLPFTFTPISATDALTPSLTEASASLGLFARVDTLTPAVTEAVSLFGSASLVDTLTPSVSDVVQALVSFLAADTLTPSATEASALQAARSLTDALTPSVNDFGTVQIQIVGADTLTPLLLDVQSLLEILRDPRTTVLLRSRFFDNVHIGVVDQKVSIGTSDANVHIGNAPITVTKRD